ncbi:cytoskeletal protein RodZ [Alkalibacillus flavidus]|uniref:Cytoskeletal protein RodZ n=1 Tax=Alkalibacillus flavidus TaxID=546021 RepID=A0ABV2KRJ0_9BACI
MEIGERLKEARESKGLSIEQVAEETKIQKRYLTAVESHDWSTMPGNFYIRAFIREYANAVGLNGEELLEEHSQELPETSSETPNYQYVTPTRSSSKSSKNNKQMFSIIPKLLVFILIIGIGFAIWYSVVNFIQPAMSDEGNADEPQDIISAPEDEEDDQEGQNSDATNDDSTNDSEQNNDSESSEDPTDEETEQPEPTLEVANVDESGTPRTVYQLSNAKTMEVTLSTDSESWLEVNTTENGESSQAFSGMFTTSDSPTTYSFEEGSAEVELNIGRASSLNIEVNGQPLTYEIDPNETVRQYIVLQWENES